MAQKVQDKFAHILENKFKEHHAELVEIHKIHGYEEAQLHHDKKYLEHCKEVLLKFFVKRIEASQELKVSYTKKFQENDPSILKQDKLAIEEEFKKYDKDNDGITVE